MGIIYTEPEYNEKNGYWCFKQSTGTNPGAIGVSCPYFSTWA